jgi:indolepyruvate ferredoxin oxidoreductase beta subunit
MRYFPAKSTETRNIKTGGKKKMNFNALLAGVGGEGVLLTSVIIARAANIEGYEVRGTQIHGLSQRGGAIPVHVRFGEDIYSPMIPRGKADVILALEPIESARYCYFASKQKTTFVIDNNPIVPLLTKVKGTAYPDINRVKKLIEPFAKKIITTEASMTCRNKLGNHIFGNIMTLGISLANNIIPLKKHSILEALKQTVPKKTLGKNIKAFEMGFEINSSAEFVK